MTCLLPMASSASLHGLHIITLQILRFTFYSSAMVVLTTTSRLFLRSCAFRLNKLSFRSNHLPTSSSEPHDKLTHVLRNYLSKNRQYFSDEYAKLAHHISSGRTAEIKYIGFIAHITFFAQTTLGAVHQNGQSSRIARTVRRSHCYGRWFNEITGR